MVGIVAHILNRWGIVPAVGYHEVRGKKRGEVSWVWGLSLELCSFNNGDSDGGEFLTLKLHLLYGKFFIKLPLKAPLVPTDEMMMSWGFTVMDDTWASIHLNWGTKCKVIHLPWEWTHVRHEMRCEDGVWRKYVGSWERKPGDPAPLRESHPYTYVCKDGTVQDDIIATIHEDEREWRWRWFTWLPWPRMIQHTIEIDFSKEVGERRGSWKGGTMGCGYSIKPGERPVEALRRMERERKFD